MSAPEPRKGMPSPQLDFEAFRARYRERFADPAFRDMDAEIDRLAQVAFDAYDGGRKAPVTRKAGPQFADPDYDMSVDWLATREAILKAKARHEDKSAPPRILLVNGSARSEHTCPGEMSKSWRMIEIARGEFDAAGFETEVLDLSRLTSEYGRNIHPCKACFSTAAALCHFPCSCYPNHAEGQVQDWMAEIYPMWMAAHGVFIVSPVNWYQVTSPIKLMMDRLVCADGGNPDPTTTHGKDARKAKQIELEGWGYPKHLEGRLFGVIVHGDVEGAENVRRSLSDWLCFMGLCPAGPEAELDRYIGYWEPYATNHEAFDKDKAMQEEVRNAALTLLNGVKADHAGQFVRASSGRKPARQK